MESNQVSQPKMEIVCDDIDPFGDKQESKLLKCKERAHKLKEKIKNYTSEDFEFAKIAVEKYKQKLTKEWPALFGHEVTKIYVHVDLDAFYASCEILSKPEYKNIPVGIGSLMMLATSNYEARKYGVKAGMPGYMAKRLCPQLVIVKANFQKYNYYSDWVMSILATYNPELEIYGIDEANLSFDIVKLRNAIKIWDTNKEYGRGTEDKEIVDFDDTLTFENVEWITNKIRRAVHRITGLTISAGISVCRGIAKYASDVKKPDGQYTIKENYEDFLDVLRVDKINGIGKYTKEMLSTALDIKTIRDLKDNMHLLNLVLPEKSYINLHRLSYGLITFDGNTVFYQNGTMKSKARDFTFPSTDSYPFFCDALWDISNELEYRLEKSNYIGFVVTLHVRLSDFTSFTRQKKLKTPICINVDIYNTAYDIFMSLFSRQDSKGRRHFYIEQTINLLGIRLSELIKKSEYNLIAKYKAKTQNFDIPACCVCNKKIDAQTEIEMMRHINTCLIKHKRKERKQKESLLWYLT